MDFALNNHNIFWRYVVKIFLNDNLNYIYCSIIIHKAQDDIQFIKF